MFSAIFLPKQNVTVQNLSFLSQQSLQGISLSIRCPLDLWSILTCNDSLQHNCCSGRLAVRTVGRWTKWL